WPHAGGPQGAPALVTPAPKRGRTLSASSGNGERNDVLGGAPLLGGSPLTPGPGGLSTAGVPALPAPAVPVSGATPAAATPLVSGGKGRTQPVVGSPQFANPTPVIPVVGAPAPIPVVATTPDLTPTGTATPEPSLSVIQTIVTQAISSRPASSTPPRDARDKASTDDD